MAGVSGMVAVALMMMITMAHHVAARPAKLHDSSTCSTSDTYVYPYWSLCGAPAELFAAYHYVSTSLLGGIEPEYDESNSTYYVRFTGSAISQGATYLAVVASEDSDTLLVNSTVYIYNAQSGRALQWRQEGTDEYFLIEQEVSAATQGAPFRLLQAEEVPLPCPLIYPPAQCHAYFVVSDPDSSTYADAGFLAYKEGDATYIKAAPAGSTGDLPLLLIRSSTSFPTIRTVTK